MTRRTTATTAPTTQLECAVAIVPGILPSTVRSILPVARATRRIMARHQYDQLTALAYLAETKPHLYQHYSRAVRRDPAFAQMTMPLSTFVERFDAALSTTSGRDIAA